MVNVWSIRPPAQLLVEDIDDFLVCYSSLTGETHILDAFPAAVMACLSLSSGPIDQIRDKLAEQMAEEGDQLLLSLEDVLLRLQHLQLVDKRPA